MKDIKPNDMNTILANTDKLSNEDVNFISGRNYRLKVDVPYRKLKDIISDFNHNEPDEDDMNLIELLTNHCNIIDNELWLYFKTGTILEYVDYLMGTPEFKIGKVYIRLSIYPLKLEKYSDMFEEI